MDDIKQVITNNLNKYINCSKYSKKELAEFLGVSAPNLTRWTKGDNFPTINLLPRLCELLEISLDQLFGISGNVNISEFDSLLLNRYKELSEDQKVMINGALGIKK